MSVESLGFSPKRAHTSSSNSDDHFADVESTANLGEAYHKSKEEVEAEKMALWAELTRFVKAGAELTNKNLTINSDITLLEMEVVIQRQNADEDQKVFLARLLLGLACRGVEFGSKLIRKKVNGKFLSLEGWTKIVMADTMQFDPILRRCYRKLFPNGVGESNPFVDLAGALAISAITFHFMKPSVLPNPTGPGVNTTTVPSNSNTFMDHNVPGNVPTPSQTRNPPPQGGGGGGFMDTIMQAMGPNNPLSSILGMMGNGGMGNFMNSVQGMVQPAPASAPPNPVSSIGSPFGHSGQDTFTPTDALREDTYATPVGASHAPPTPRTPRTPPTPRSPRSSRSSHSSRKRPLTPPFDERTGKRQSVSTPRSPRSPIMGEPPRTHRSTTNASYDTASAQTMECDSSEDEID